MKRYFVSVLALLALAGSAWGQIPTGNLSMWLRADAGVAAIGPAFGSFTSGSLVSWRDQTSNHHDATSDDKNPINTPDATWVANGINGLPSVEFDGAHFLDIAGQVLTGQQFTIFVVGTDTGPISGGGQRELFSDFDHNNINSNAFIGTTSNIIGSTRVAQFTDGFTPTVSIHSVNAGATPSNTPFILSGQSSNTDGAAFLDGSLLFNNNGNGPLNTIDTATAYTLGSQGAAGADLWQGDISEVIVYDGAISDADRDTVLAYLANKYNIVPEPTMLGLLATVFLMRRRSS
ncbi:MAG TPA: hypothetical protein VKK61_09315 [Tepidisphaeraceae bacterium]|jgi:hypothetical protein|nr:hypothetical protein [Tepidisphaeraceae bacterium]